MQDRILLGFLIKGSKTGYQIKKEMEQSTEYFFNTSQGSTNPAFKKLEANRMVTTEEKVENGRLKKIYSITSEGKEHFQSWMNSKIGISKIKDEMMLRLFFFPHISNDERIKIIEKYLQELSVLLQHLNNIENEMNISGKCNEFDWATLEFGKDYYQFIYDWFSKYLEKLKIR
jgi:DNA-binding PadR family transcriptional regulator